MAIKPPQGFSTEHDALAIGEILDGKYKILNVLGMGGMGIVYLAENVAIGRTVAIKILRSRARRDTATLQRFRQEAQVSATIGHPGIVDVLDMGETESGQGYMVMERLEGESLAARLKQRGKLSLQETLSIITEALDAIAAAHAKGIVHRDLKPDNLFLVWRPKWCVKILDFGISRVESDEDELRLTGSNMVMGSVMYMPPEQARDARAAGPRSDLYALGAVLYQALAGRPPFVGSNYSETLSKVLTDPHEPLSMHAPTVPPQLSSLVDELLAKDPAKRPANATVVRAALLALVDGPLQPPVAPSLAIGTAKTLPPGAVDVKALALTAAATARPNAALAATVDETAMPAPAPPPEAPTRSRARLVGALLGVAVVAGLVVVIARRDSGDPNASAAVDAMAIDGAAAVDVPPVVVGPVDAAPSVPVDQPVDAPVDAPIVPVDAIRTRVIDAAPRMPRVDAGVVDAARAEPPKPDAYTPLEIQPTPGTP